MTRQPLRALQERNSLLQPAREGTARGTVWAVFIAIEFYLLSNPLAFQPFFVLTLQQALEFGLLLALLELPRLRFRGPPTALMAFAAVAGASWWWSMDREVTSAALWLYGSVAILSLLVAMNVTPRVLVVGFGGGGILTLVVSLYAWHQQIPSALISPDIGMDGYLAGVGTNRNILSYTMVLALGFLAGYNPRVWRGRVLWTVGVLLLLTGVFLAQSATGFLSSAAVLGVGQGLVALERLRRKLRHRIALVTSAVAVACIGLMLTFPNLLGSLTSRDSVTLSGRVPLWQAIVVDTDSARAQGFGWGTVWAHPWLPALDNTVAQEIYRGAGQFMSHGHNSFLDVLPQLGVIGVALLLVLHVTPLVKAIGVRWAERPDPEDLLASRVVLTSMTSLIIFGMTEPITSTPLGWFILCVLASLAGTFVHSRRGRRVRSYGPIAERAEGRPTLSTSDRAGRRRR